MKKTTHYKGHRWSTEEYKRLIDLWIEGKTVEEIGAALNVTNYSVLKQIVRLRQDGVPIPRRTQGHVSGRKNTPWTQSEVEYIIRGRQQKLTIEKIALDLGRSWSGVNSMIGKLRKEGVPVPMYGMGVKRLWDGNALTASIVGRHLVPIEGGLKNKTDDVDPSVKFERKV